MIYLNGSKVALIAAAVARVHGLTNHKVIEDDVVAEISKEIGAEFYSIYDMGLRDNKTRYLRFDFQTDSIEIEIGPQPVLIHTDNRPEGDDTPPGTPVAMAA